MKFFLLFALLILPSVILTFNNGSPLAYAQEDDADELVDVEGETDDNAVTDEGTEEEDPKPGASPDADTTILFTKPISTSSNSHLELPAGNLVEFLVGFTNRGQQDFILETLEASFRYPMDFTFYIQNFSTLGYNKVVKPNQEATLFYSFAPSDAFAGRPFGLNVNLGYRDVSGSYFQEAVYNETVQIVELEEGLDGETFFLYLFLAACGVLILVVGQQFLSSMGRKRGSGKKTVVETGTSNPNDVDYDWLPKETLNHFNKSSPRQSPRQQKTSPRQRKTKRSAGFDD